MIPETGFMSSLINVSVYTGELIVILLAAMWVKKSKPSSLLIATDSSSAISSITIALSKTREDFIM